MSYSTSLPIVSSNLGSNPSRNESKSPQDKLPQITPDEYGSAILTFSKLRTGDGEIHEGLAEFLNTESYTVNIDGSSGPQPGTAGGEPFLTLYEFCSTQLEDSEGRALWPKPQEFLTPEEFGNLQLKSDQECKSQVIFLRGYPSPRWLKVIGSKYKLEPDFLAQHLDFLNPSTSEDLPIVGLPTSLSHVIQLCITTIGSQDREERAYKQDEIDAMRKQDNVDMILYSSKLLKGRFNVGNAIVRHYSTLDGTHFAIEQKVSIHIQRREKSWFAFVWMDSGNDLDNSVKGPWSRCSDQTRLHPVVMYRPMDALNPTILESDKLAMQEHLNWSKQPQTAALLPHRYGSTLRPEKLDRGVMYALYEIFSLSAYSESKFLAQVDSRLRKTLGKVNTDTFDGLTDLTFIRGLLYRHIQQMHMTITALKDFQSLDVSMKRSTRAGKASETEIDAGATAAWILQDFNYNLEYAKALDKQCQEGVTILMSSASIFESRKAMAQQERIGKLTFLAFLFVPLSFTTSFFGMHFKELNDPNMSIWQWFAMSVPIVAITQIAFFFTVEQLTRPFRWLRDRMLRHKHKTDEYELKDTGK